LILPFFSVFFFLRRISYLRAFKHARGSSISHWCSYNLTSSYYSLLAEDLLALGFIMVPLLASCFPVFCCELRYCSLGLVCLLTFSNSLSVFFAFLLFIHFRRVISSGSRVRGICVSHFDSMRIFFCFP